MDKEKITKTYRGNKGKLRKRSCENCGYRIKSIGLRGSWCLVTNTDIKTLKDICKYHETYKERWS
jgi:hypothetical protein